MKYILLILLAVIILSTIGCGEKSVVENKSVTTTENTFLPIPDITINKSIINYNNKNSTYAISDQPYSGYMVSYYPDETLKEKIGILNGRKQNEAIQYFPDGHPKHLSNYHKGKLHGKKKTWSETSPHILIANLNYHLGKAHGTQKKWYTTGELFKKLNLNMGKEEGIQQAFRKNGDLYANYEAKAGRIFGLKKAALCFGLEDEKIQNEK